MDKRKGGWLMKQTWEHLLFLHWPVPVEDLREKLPSQLELDTFDEEAWIGIVPFAVNHMRVHGLPEIPFARSFLQCNVRTYVTYNGEPGVYFFSLDADHAPSVMGARSFFHLPYYHAEMEMYLVAETINYKTRRTHKGTKGESLNIVYTPGERLSSPTGSLTEWLSERYCLWTVKGNQVYKGDIDHDPWELFEAESVIHEQSLWAGLQDKRPVHQCYSPKQTAYIWPLSR